MDSKNYASGHPGPQSSNNNEDQQQHRHHQQTNNWAMRNALQDCGEPGGNERQLPTSIFNVQQRSLLQRHGVAAHAPMVMPQQQQQSSFASLIAGTFGDVVSTNAACIYTDPGLVSTNAAEDATTLEDMIGPDTVVTADLSDGNLACSRSIINSIRSSSRSSSTTSSLLDPTPLANSSAFMSAAFLQQNNNQMLNNSNNNNMMRTSTGGMEQQPLPPHAQHYHHDSVVSASIPQPQQQEQQQPPPPLQPADFTSMQELQQSQDIISAQQQELQSLQLQLQQLQRQAMMRQQQGLYEQQQQQPPPPWPQEQLSSNQNAAAHSAAETSSDTDGTGGNNPPSMVSVTPAAAAAAAAGGAATTCFLPYGSGLNQNLGGASGIKAAAAQQAMTAATNPFLLHQFGVFPPPTTAQNPYLFSAPAAAAATFPQPLASTRVQRTSSLEALLSSASGGQGATTLPPSLGSLNPAVVAAAASFPQPLASTRVQRTSSLEALLSSSSAGALSQPYLTNPLLLLPGAVSSTTSNGNQRGSKKSSKKDRNRPTRPLSAYNLFFKDERARMLTDLDEKKKKSNKSGMKRKRGDESTIDNLEDNDDNNDNGAKLPARDINSNMNNDADIEELHMTKKGKIGFAAMAQAIGAKWKLIDEQTLSHYREIASEDMKRYRQEMEEYKQDGGDGGKNNGHDEEDD